MTLTTPEPRYTLGGLDPEINAFTFPTLTVADLNADEANGFSTPVSGDTLAFHNKPEAQRLARRRARIRAELS